MVGMSFVDTNRGIRSEMDSTGESIQGPKQNLLFFLSFSTTTKLVVLSPKRSIDLYFSSSCVVSSFPSTSTRDSSFGLLLGGGLDPFFFRSPTSCCPNWWSQSIVSHFVQINHCCPSIVGRSQGLNPELRDDKLWHVEFDEECGSAHVSTWDTVFSEKATRAFHITQ